MPQAGPPAAPWLPTAPEQEEVLRALEGHRIRWEDGAAGSSTSTAQSCPVPASDSLAPFCHPDSWQHRRGVAGSRLLQRLPASARLTSGRDRPLLWAALGTGVWSSIRPPPLQASSTACQS